MDISKQTRAWIDRSNILTVSFELDDGTKVDDAVIVRDAEGYSVGIIEETTEEGDRQRRYLKLQKRIVESQHAAVEFYEDHEKLVKGVGMVAIGAGMVVTGSLFVKRHHKKD